VVAPLTSVPRTERTGDNHAVRKSPTTTTAVNGTITTGRLYHGDFGVGGGFGVVVRVE
jgi:hypothetical protein